MPSPLKPVLSVSVLGTRRFILGLVAGIGFAVCLHAAGLTVARLAHLTVSSLVPHRLDHLFTLLAVPKPAAPPAPWWAEPLWASFVSALGQAVTLATWFIRPRRPWMRHRRAHRRAVLGATTGAMWVGLALYMVDRLWTVYVFMTQVNIRAAIRNLGMIVDPFAPYGPVLMVGGVLMLTAVPWSGIRLGYRCGWWPLIGAASVAIGWAVLYAVGLMLPG